MRPRQGYTCYALHDLFLSADSVYGVDSVVPPFPTAFRLLNSSMIVLYHIAFLGMM